VTYSKSKVFNKDLQEMAIVAKALSHPARLAILKFLSEQKSCISGDISDQIPLSRTTVSQHLQELKKAGLIQGTINGLKINYCINKKRAQFVNDLFTGFLSEVAKDNDFICQ
jgi:ArsR family transcriptional regulator, arsenate/arsenite/antimonite-responsive transcriptional repressor